LSFIRRVSSALLVLSTIAVSACSGATAPRSIPVVEGQTRSLAGPAPTATPSCLYTDAQLRTDPDPEVPAVKSAYESWIAANAIPVRSEACDTDFSDLQPFGAVVAGKRIVGLGESSHGVGDYSEVKTRMVEYLHEKLGFDVIAFEYDMFNDYEVNAKLPTLSAKQAMWQGGFAVWWSTQALPLFAYIQAQSKTSHPLILAGFDIQAYVTKPASRRRAFYAAIAPYDAAYAATASKQDETYLEFLNSAPFPATKKWLAKLHKILPQMNKFYAGLGSWMGAHMNQLVANASDKNLPGLMRQIAIGTLAYAKEQATANDMAASVAARDAGMAADVNYLANTLYPGKKIILWAHNQHVARGEQGFPSMGSIIEANFGSQYYATGLLPLRGRGAYGPGQTYKEPPPPANSIDAILYYSRMRWAYVDLSRQSPAPGNAWMSGHPLLYDYFGYYIPPAGVPDRTFDGLVYVDTIHPPTYLYPSSEQVRRNQLPQSPMLSR
jgi:erythromycin esterase